MTVAEAVEYAGYEPLRYLVDKEAGDAQAGGWDEGRVRHLLHALGDPQRAVRCTLVSGSKGKGSTAVLLASMLQAAGRRTGLFLQPHLHRYAERVLIDGRPLGRRTSRRGLGYVLARRREPVTAFEVLTAFALWQFAESGCREAVLEAGFGGTLDATAAADPEVVLLGPVEAEHREVFGPTALDVARFEGRLATAARRAFTVPQPDPVMRILQEEAASAGGRWLTVQPAEPRGAGFLLHTPAGLSVQGELALEGVFQLSNVALAAAGAEALGCSPATVADGASGAWLAGRYERIGSRPTVIVDGAHTPLSAQLLRASLEREPTPRTALVVGMLRDKDSLGFLRALAPVADAVWAVEAPTPRARGAEELAQQATQVGVRWVRSSESTEDALLQARQWAGTQGRVVVCGSFRVVAAARWALLGRRAAATARVGAGARPR